MKEKLLVPYSKASKMPSSDIVYFSKEYLDSQAYSNLFLVSVGNTKCLFSIEKGIATSLSKSPFGSFLGNTPIQNQHMEKLIKELHDLKVNRLKITHPSSIYDDFVDPENFEALGFLKTYDDFNQHIALQEPVSLHEMEKRKLVKSKKEGIVTKRMSSNELSEIHDFIALARQEQGLKINISKSKLKALVANLPNSFDFWGSFLGDEMIACTVVTLVNNKIAYYFLPATPAKFRTRSPMVVLLNDMAAYYRENGFTFFDLGVSSIDGIKQEGLFLFKERMGAITTLKPTYELVS